MSELKARLLGQTMNEYGCDTKIYLKSEADNAIAELKAENERLVKCCKEYDSSQRIDELIKFNYSQKLRAAKRALYKSCANWAKS